MSLNERQIKILKLKAEGKTNRQVARALHIHTTTVETNLTKICEHFGVSKPSAAVAKAQKQGIIPLPEADPIAALTARELAVGRLVVQGKSNKEISTLLDIGARAVAKRISSMLRKLNCANRVQLAAVLSARGVK